MVSKKKKRKTTRRKKRKSTSPYMRKLKQFKPKLLQSVGAFTIFFVVFIILSGIVIFRWIDTTNQRRSILIQQEQVFEQRENFIQDIAPIAQKLQRQYGVLASISMAQAALESNYGESQLGSNYNNLYGVKADESDVDKVLLPTMEFIDDEWIEIQDYFKVYPTWEASMEGHAELIVNGTSWDPNFYQPVLDGENYHEQADGLQEAGYATDPTYSNKLVELIETWELDQYDQPLP